MSEWDPEDLVMVEYLHELDIAFVRRDGRLRPYRIMWGVRVGDDFYVRSVNGRTAAWYRGTLTRHEGRILAGALELDVSFADVEDDDLNARIDEAYREKYGRNSRPVQHITSFAARGATLRVAPR